MVHVWKGTVTLQIYGYPLSKTIIYKKNQAGVTILQLAFVQQLGLMGLLMVCCLKKRIIT
jgi:hypothetical protein